MNRLQKKCLIVSALAHMFLLAILVFGPAFVPRREPAAEVFEVIEFTPLRTTDLPVTGGGSPSGVLPQPVPEPKQVTPPEPVVPKPEPKPQAQKPVQPARQGQNVKQDQVAPAVPARSTEPSFADTKPARRLPQVSTQLVTRAKVTGTGAQGQPGREAARARADQFAAVASTLRQQLSSGTTTVELLGPGGGGIPYANFKQAVFSVYYNAWNPPAVIANESAVTKATVIIARDGTVISARITEPSGDAAMDASVQRALERVKYAAPLPEGTSEPQRTLTIIFDLRAKRGIG